MVMEKREVKMGIPIADILMLELMQSGTVQDESNQMRTYMFCMDIENVSKELDIELPEDMFIDQFIEEIQKCSGYHSFASFCEVDENGLKDLGHKAYELLK